MLSDQPIAVSSDSYVSLRDGHQMPWIGLGVWQTPIKDTAQIVNLAVSLGYKAVDTATLYGNEAGVGKGLENHKDIFVTTKLWNINQGFENTLSAFEKSSYLLNRHVLDLYLIHWPMPQQDLYVESWRALIKLRQEGRIKSIGVSNFMPEHIERLIKETGEVPAVNQIEIHPSFQQKDVRAFNEKHGIQTQAWRPLGKGAALKHPEIIKIASRLGRTPAQIILRWHLQNRIMIIPKSIHKERLKENLNLFNFVLTEQDMAIIESLDRKDGRLGADPRNAKFN